MCWLEQIIKNRLGALILLMLAVIAGGSSDAPAAPLQKPIVVSILSFPIPPLLHATEDGEFSGTMGETVKALCVEQFLDCRFTVLPLARAYMRLKNGQDDALITLDLGQFVDCCAS